MIKCTNDSDFKDIVNRICDPRIIDCFIVGLVILFVAAIFLGLTFFILFVIPALNGEGRYWVEENFWKCYKKGYKSVYIVYGLILVAIGIIIGFGCLIIYVF